MTPQGTQAAKINLTPEQALTVLIEEMQQLLPFEAVHLAVGGHWFPRTVTPEHPLSATGKIPAWRLNWSRAPLSRWQTGSLRCNGKRTVRRDYRLRVGKRQWHVVLIGGPATPDADVLEELTEHLHSILTPKRTESLFQPVA